MLASIVVGVTACLTPKPFGSQVADFTAAEGCIQQHWGEPITQLAGECVGGELAAAEDLIADIEAAFELGATAGAGDPAKVRAKFPYQTLIPKVTARLAKAHAP
jgi:hypothetical protein